MSLHDWIGPGSNERIVEDTLVLQDYRLGMKPPPRIDPSLWTDLTTYLPAPSQISGQDYKVYREIGYDRDGEYFHLKLDSSEVSPWHATTVSKIGELKFREAKENGFVILRSTEELELPWAGKIWKVAGAMRICRVPQDATWGTHFKLCALVKVINYSEPAFTFNAAWCWPH